MIMRLSNMRDGFTLAEVLITLGIIGVVAAMTMPTLMNSTQGAQYKAAYKKALSALSQGVTLNVALDGGSFADVEAGTAGKYAESDDAGKTTIAKILGARMNVVRADATTAPYTITNSSGVDLPDVDTYLFFNDGIMFAFKNAISANTTCTINTDGGGGATPCEGYIDVNGQKGPNKVVSCNTGSGDGVVKTAKDTYDKTTGEKTGATSCTVGNPTDVYPVYFYDQTVTPATNAASAVLYSK